MAKNRGLPEERGVSGRSKKGAGSVASTAATREQRVPRAKRTHGRRRAAANSQPKTGRKKR